MGNYLQKDTETLAVQSNLNSFKKIYQFSKRSTVRRWLIGLLILLTAILFLPWTQNIRAKGQVTTVRQEQRPQQINSVLAGSIIKWYVQEGDFIEAGDTILQLGEVKAEYLDPQLLNRTKEQIIAKQQTIDAYKNKASTAVTQAEALEEGLVLKLKALENKIEQQQLKIKTEEADKVAADNELNAYQRQIEAAKVMLDSGAISLTEFEKRKINYQNGMAKIISAGNKITQSRQELMNLRIERESALQDYTEKIAKTRGERFSTLSDAANSEAELAKLENLAANYDARNQLYYVIAPQKGQVSKAKKAGLGEMIKEGEMIAEIVPDSIQHAVELFVNPMDLPLISPGQKVRFIFDGFPAIVFSGWPGGSYGTFGGKVFAVEKSISVNGKFRVLVTEDPSDKRWPAQLRIGAGANGIMLLKDVRIYYELWRTINGFPPAYYKPAESKPAENKPISYLHQNLQPVL
jgi:multidrug resistance efflux pump